MASSRLETYMAKHPIFKGISPEHMAVVAEHAQEVTFNPGVLILQQDANADRFYLIIEGQVALEIPALYGSPINIQSVGPGEVVGWSWLFPPYKLHFDARAEEPTTLIQVDGERLRVRCQEDPRLGYELACHFATLMMQRLDAARRKVMDMYGPDT